MTVEQWIESLPDHGDQSLVGVPPRAIQKLLDKFEKLKSYSDLQDTVIVDFEAAMQKETQRREEAESDRNAALMLVAKIREAVGDPKGKLMQDDLIAHCRELKEFYNEQRREQ